MSVSDVFFHGKNGILVLEDAKPVPKIKLAALLTTNCATCFYRKPRAWGGENEAGEGDYSHEGREDMVVERHVWS
jgi:hypothetical protein